MIRYAALLSSILCLVGCFGGGDAAMRARANQMAAKCKQDPSAPMCQQHNDDGAATPTTTTAAAGPTAVKLSNGCVNAVTFLFDGCGWDSKKLVTVAAGDEKSVNMSFPDGVNCSVCIAKGGGDCKMLATMFTNTMTQASVNASAGCDSPTTN